MTDKVQVQPLLVPLTYLQGQSRPVPLLMAQEWHRVLEDMARRINELEARIDAAGIPAA